MSLVRANEKFVLNVVSGHFQEMRWKKDTYLNGDPMSTTRPCTNDSENVAGSRETRVRTVGNGDEKDSQVTTRTGKWGHRSEEAKEDDDDDMELLNAKASTFVNYEYENMRRKRRTCTAANVALKPPIRCDRSRHT